MLTDEHARQFAEEWYKAWNAHDLDRVLSHYREDVAFSSPFLRTVDDNNDGTLIGRANLAEYFARAVATYPNLRFEPVGLFVGADGVVLHYRSVRGLLAAEAMALDSDLRVMTASAHYDELP